ncbi:MAG: DUF3299 domain-containing protein [Pseudomonadota bacterium]
MFDEALWRRWLVGAAMLFAASTAHQSLAMQAIGWTDLIDESVQSFDDPYAALTPEQLMDLVTIARLRVRLQAEDIAPEPRDRIEIRLKSVEAGLANVGIDVDWLISQRWIVADRRKTAATTGNPRVDGVTVTMTGFAIPAPLDVDGHAVAYLVPERGMCSHMPPPNPNQMVRIRYPADTRPLLMHEPVRVTGRIDISPTEHAIHVVDGLVPMHATFALQANSLEPLAQKPFSASAADGTDWSDANAAQFSTGVLPAHALPLK